MQTMLQLITQPRRQHILQLLWDRELSAGDIARQNNVTFGAVSQHLRLLRQADLVRVRRSGRQRLYRVNKSALGPLARSLAAVWRSQLSQLKRLAEAEERQHGDR